MSRNKIKFTTAVVSGALLLSGLTACNRDQSTESLLAEAKQYQQKGDDKAALIQLKNAVAKSPEDAEARLQLGTLYLETGDAVSADKELRKAASLGMAPARTLPLLAKSLQNQGQFKEMLDEIKPELAAKSAPLMALRGDALLATGDADGAKAAYEAALALDPNSGAALTGLARHSLIKNNDKETGQRYLADAVAKDSKNPDVWMFQAGMLRGLNKPEEALAAFDKVLALRPQDRNANLEKAYIFINQKKFAEARTEIEAARKIAPSSLLVTYGQALLEFNEGKNKEARESLQRVLKSAPNHMPSVLLAGAVELNLDAALQAQLHLRKYLEVDPKNMYARKLLAQAYLKGSQPDEAAATLAPALTDSKDPQLLALAGESYMQARDFGKATANLEKASQLAPNVAVLRTSLGMSRLQQGDTAKGIVELERATELDPKSERALAALVQAELGLKHYDKALAAVNKLETLTPNEPQTHNLKATVLLTKGDVPAARAAFEKALQINPTFFPAAANLAKLDMIEKKPDAARKRFEAILEKDKKNFGAMGALAELAMYQQRPEEATTWLEKAQAENPDAIAPVLKLGSHYLMTKQEKKALTLARKFQTTNPTSPEMMDLLGQAQLANNDPQGALDSYSKLVNMAPKSALAQMRLAQVQGALKNDTGAAESLKKASALAPNMLQTRVAQVELAMRRGRLDEAMTLARQLQQDTPGSPVGFLLEGDMQKAQNKPALALVAYDKAFAITKQGAVLLRSAQMLRQMGKEAEANGRVAQWAKAHPEDLQVAMYMAEAHLAAREYKSASVILEDIVKRAPNSGPALNNLAWAYQQQKDPRALATAEQAYKVASDHAAVQDTLGWMLVEQGNTQRGLPLLQKAAAAPMATPEIRYHLAVAMHKSGDKTGARKELETLLAQNKPFAQLEEARSLLKTL
ncbi:MULTISPECIES: XrtA/PEP-CTERM system TPR-repeat protein PrsT [unclassified Massilia]|uniref:XrtA/PEP-CTERM system TPR-repeat protein PrsT n=1 Tax=unclassified Massilia TaxID=2609279 RepID=UPI001784DF42|nr:MULTISPECIES: XrtA/PEP-CTERM system TPR-repeat protein PrsT [unclassified Massilia]MBD8533260.1 PEP-CTERM system TPR-repeat protein PrsT [Massilia sp. CFBP 13647]MBD8674433.1 PEP-CTERM system TPR-repeat protein PrsT [Massilia sp. CFBP 13721]